VALAGLLGAACCLPAAPASGPARAAGPGLGECRPLLWPEPGEGLVTCYQPTHAALTGRVAPVRAIDPAPTVRRVTARGIAIGHTAYASFATWCATAAARGYHLSVTVDSNTGEAQVFQMA